MNLGEQTAGSTTPGLTKEYATVTWFWNEGNIQLPDDGYISRKVMEDLDIEYIHISPKGTDYIERLMLLISGGETPDIITSYNDLTVQLKRENIIIPLDEYLNEQYIPNVIRISKDWDLALESLVFPDGQIYSIPNCNNNPIGEAPWIRADWLDALGLSVPETMDELLDVLIAFSAMNQHAADAPHVYATMSNEHWGTMPFANVYGAGMIWYPGEDGLPELGFLSTRVKDYLRFVKALVDNNAINQDIMLTKFEQVKEMVRAGRVGYVYGWSGKSDEREMQLVNPDAKWSVIPPPKGAYDDAYLFGANDSIIRETYLVSSTCKDIDTVFRLMDYFATDTSDENNITYEGPYWEMAFGERGINWDIYNGRLENGNGSSGDAQISQAFADQNRIDNWAVLCRRFRNQFDTTWMGSREEDVAANKTIMSFPTAADIPANHPLKPIAETTSMDNPAISSFVLNWSTTKFIETIFYDAIFGKADIDILYDAFLDNANRDGYQEIRAAMFAHLQLHN